MSERRLCACTIIFNTMGNILFGYKIKYGAWEVPGGKADGDERVIATAVRELQEETGLIIPHLQYVGYYDLHPKWCLHVFTGLKTTYMDKPQLMEPDKHTVWKFKSLQNVIDEGCTEVTMGMINTGFFERAKEVVFNSVAYEGLVAR